MMVEEGEKLRLTRAARPHSHDAVRTAAVDLLWKNDLRVPQLAPQQLAAIHLAQRRQCRHVQRGPRRVVQRALNTLHVCT